VSGVWPAPAPIVHRSRLEARSDLKLRCGSPSGYDMFRSLKNLERYVVSATDGELGSVVNFLLADERWVVRHLVVETGSFFTERRVLISPISFRGAEWSTHRFEVAFTMDKVKNSPSLDTDKPVSRQHERDYHAHYGYPYYWGYSGSWGMGRYPYPLADAKRNEASSKESDASGDAHLRSVKDVCGYKVHGERRDDRPRRRLHRRRRDLGSPLSGNRYQLLGIRQEGARRAALGDPRQLGGQGRLRRSVAAGHQELPGVERGCRRQSGVRSAPLRLLWAPHLLGHRRPPGGDAATAPSGSGPG
jgi:hypothetical protein